MANFSCISCGVFVANDKVRFDPVSGDGPVCVECYEDLKACHATGVFVSYADILEDAE